MGRLSILNEIRRLDAVRDHQRIVQLTTCYEFPFDTTRALEFALFRTFCVPSIGALLDKTGEFSNRAQKRYDDTDLIISEMMEHGYDSERGRAALRRMNQIHGRFAIANEDFLYVLSTFVFEPIRWNRRFGWRRMHEKERLALFQFWREVGKRMNIKEIPESYHELEAYNVAYERRFFRFTAANRRVGDATCAMFAAWFPAPVRPLVKPAIYAMLDEPVLTAFGYPTPSPQMRQLMRSLLRLKARFEHALPPRTAPRLRTNMKRPTYPDGYRIEELGPKADSR
jgi:hypothetical protein